jgi:nucleotide-binding universal stress UspA family protein
VLRAEVALSLLRTEVGDGMGLPSHAGRRAMAMFKHILLPTDGSGLSERAIHDGIAMAKALGARITGMTATRPYHVVALDPLIVTDTKATYDEHTRAIAGDRLSVIEKAAQAADVRYQLVHRVGEHPYEEIIKTATDTGCDAIFMASHGRRGISAVVIGSETTKVLTHTKLPVIVYR